MNVHLGSVLRQLANYAWPERCAACGQLGPAPFCPICRAATIAAEPFVVPGVDASVAAFEYGGPVADAIHRLKYGRAIENARTLSRTLAPLLREFADFDGLVPVPLTRRAMRRRGFNQAMELARGLGQTWPHATRRTKQGPAQATLDRAARLVNLQQAFALGRTPVRGARVVIIDDVVTTGATMQAIARTLRRGGALRVFGLALARAG